MNQNSSRSVSRFGIFAVAFLLVTSSVVSFPAFAGIGGLNLSGTSAASATSTSPGLTPSDGTPAGNVNTGILGGTLSYYASATAAGSPTIWTDQSSYPPLSTVIINGSGFLPDSTVTVSVTDPNGGVTSWNVTSDSSGDFTTTYLLDDLQGTYYVSATDGTNTAPTISFEDAVNLNILGKDGAQHQNTHPGVPENLGTVVKGTYLDFTNLTVAGTGLGSGASVTFALTCNTSYGNGTTICPLTTLTPGTYTLTHNAPQTSLELKIATGTLSINTTYAGNITASATGAGSGYYYFYFKVVAPTTVGLTLSYEVIGGGSPTAPTFTCGTFSQPITTTPAVYNVPSGCSWTITNPLGGSGTTERWQSNDAYLTGTASSAQAIVFHYYHQFNVTFQYRISDSSTPGAPTVYYTQFGDNTKSMSAALDPLTTSSDWVDAGASIMYDNPLSSSSLTERWQTNLLIVSSKSTIASSVGNTTSPTDPLYYHQYKVTFGYTTNDGTKIDSYTNLVNYTQFGSTLHLSTDNTGALSLSNDWADAGTQVLYVSPVIITANVERYKISSTDSGTNVVISSVSGSNNNANPEYYHQFVLTVSVTPYPPIGVSNIGINPVGVLSSQNASSESYWYNSTVSVTLIANPYSGYTFSSWTLDGSSQGVGVDKITVKMNSTHMVTASYLPITMSAYMTDSDFNPISSLSAVFNQCTTTACQLTATNPGTEYYNLQFTNNGETTISGLTISITFPYDSAFGGCAFVLKPSTTGQPVQVNGAPVTYTMGACSASGAVLSVNAGSVNPGQTITLTVHIDYAFKTISCAQSAPTYCTALTFNRGYSFSTQITFDSSSAKANDESLAVLGKKVTAIGGLLLDTNGYPKSGLTVNLYNSNNVLVATMSSGTDGWYFFALTASGTYTIKVFNSISTQIAIQTNIKVSLNQFVEVDFKSLSPSDPVIQGFVLDNTGLGVAHVTVQLIDNTGRVVATTTTSDGGFYAFRFSRPGTYTVRILVPSGYTSTSTSVTISLKQFQVATVNFNLIRQ